MDLKVCKVCGLVYPGRISKCKNDGYSDFEEFNDIEKVPMLVLEFGKEQTNYFKILPSSLPLDIIHIDTQNKFYYPFIPNYKLFPIKMKLDEIFNPEEVILEKISSDSSMLTLNLNRKKIKSRVYFRKEGATEFKEVEDDSIELHALKEKYLKSEALKIKNIIITYRGVR